MNWKTDPEKQRVARGQILDYFERLNGVLAREGAHQDIVIIGAAALILNGMDDRATQDIDFYGNSEDLKPHLREVAKAMGFRFDPHDYVDIKEPYIQWVWPDFVSMPLTDTWKSEQVELWAGSHLRVFMPPVGVMIAAKMAAGRNEVDFGDALYLMQAFPDWEGSYNKYKEDFKESDRDAMEDNLRVLPFMLPQKSEQNPTDPRLFRHKP